MNNKRTSNPVAKPEAAARVGNVSLSQRLQNHWDQCLLAWRTALARLLTRPLASILTIGVMAIAMVLPLALVGALANIEHFAGQVRDAREIAVFLTTETDQSAAQAVAERARQLDGVDSLQLRTPDQGLDEFRQMSDVAGALDVLDSNPLPYVLIIAPAADTDVENRLLGQLRELPGVALVQYDAAWRQRLGAWLAFGEQLALIIALLLGIGLLLVVGNTVRLEVGARSEEIAVLQQLGAFDGYIRRPFIYQGILYGLASGALALALLAVAGVALQSSLAALVSSYGTQFTLRGPSWPQTLALLAGTMALGWAGARVAVGHHLRRTRPTQL